MDKLRSDLKSIILIDKELAKYLDRLLNIINDMAALGVDLQSVADKGFTTEAIEDANFLRSRGYKFAEEGLSLTRLMIKRIVCIRKKDLSDDVLRSLNTLADDILEIIDPLLHDQLKMLGPYRHVD